MNKQFFVYTSSHKPSIHLLKIVELVSFYYVFVEKKYVLKKEKNRKNHFIEIF